MSLGIVLGIVVLAVVLLPRPHYDAVKPIDPTQAILSAQRVAPYHIVRPVNLPPEWKPTSATVNGPDDKRVVHLHIGYYTPKGNYVALEESNGDAVDFIKLETAHGKFIGQLTIGDNAWEKRYAGNQKDSSLNLGTPDGATVIVTGSAGFDELEQLAASLR
jgi:hypothetical protein